MKKNILIIMLLFSFVTFAQEPLQITTDATKSLKK